MIRILMLLLLLPVICFAQDDLKSGRLEVNKVDEASHDTVKSTYWQVLEHPAPGSHLTTFYRFSSINGAYFLDLKIMEGGNPFVVARNAECRLILERGIVVALKNLNFQKSCKGCGAKGYWGNDAQGVTLSSRIYDFDLNMLMNYYAHKIRVYTADGYLERNINTDHSELFMDELYLIYNANNQKKKTRIVD